MGRLDSTGPEAHYIKIHFWRLWSFSFHRTIYFLCLGFKSLQQLSSVTLFQHDQSQRQIGHPGLSFKASSHCPNVRPPFGPQLSRLPDELLAEIFKIIVTTMFPSTSRFHTSINPKNFDILNRHYAIDRLRKVSKAFYAFFTQAFYENFTFSFITKPLIDLQSKYLTSIPTPLPRPSLRHHLRSIHIQIVLENSFFTPGTRHPACHDAARRISREITSATQLFTFCPAARRLRYLTNPEMGGFGGLRFLYIAIRTDFKYLAVSEQFLRALEEANFVLRARKVALEVTGDMGVVGADQEEVRKRIVIE